MTRAHKRDALEENWGVDMMENELAKNTKLAGPKLTWHNVFGPAIVSSTRVSYLLPFCNPAAFAKALARLLGFALA